MLKKCQRLQSVYQIGIEFCLMGIQRSNKMEITYDNGCEMCESCNEEYTYRCLDCNGLICDDCNRCVSQKDMVDRLLYEVECGVRYVRELLDETRAQNFTNTEQFDWVRDQLYESPENLYNISSLMEN